MEIFESIPCRFEAARTKLALAEVVAGRGDLGAAASLLVEARATLTASAAPLHVQRVDLLAERLGVSGDENRAA